MIIQFDKARLQLFINVGPTESHEPIPSLIEAHEKLQALKKEVEDFQKDKMDTVIKEIDALVNELNKQESARLNPASESK